MKQALEESNLSRIRSSLNNGTIPFQGAKKKKLPRSEKDLVSLILLEYRTPAIERLSQTTTRRKGQACSVLSSPSRFSSAGLAH